MKTVVIVGGSKGIGNAIVETLVDSHKVINISRSAPEKTHVNLTHFNCDILNDELPEITAMDALVYCPGSINLKPIARLSLEDFRQDFEINVIGAVKTIQKYLVVLKKANDHRSYYLARSLPN